MLNDTKDHKWLIDRSMCVIQVGTKRTVFSFDKVQLQQTSSSTTTLPQESHLQVVVLILSFELISLFFLHFTPETFEKRSFHSENTHAFPVNTLTEDNSGRGNKIQHRDYVICEKLRFQNVFRPRENRKHREPTESARFQFPSV